MDWRLHYDANWLTHPHLQGKEHRVKITKIEKGELTGRDGKKTHKLVFRFEGKDLPWAAPKTNCALIAKEYGNDVDKWVGRELILYTAQVQGVGGEMVDAIRAKTVPK